MPESVPAARKAVKSYLASLTADDGAAAALAVTEAVANAVRHAYPNGTEGEIEIEAHQTTDQLVQIVIRDHGRGPIVDPDTKGLGAGIPLMLATTEKLEIQGRPGQGTQVTLTIRLP